MLKVFTGVQYHELINHTLSRQKLSLVDFVERGTVSLVYEFMRHYHPTRHDVYIFAGGEDNGAYGLCLARLLAEHHYKVSVYLFYKSGTISSACQELRDRLIGTGVSLEEVYNTFTPPALAPNDIAVDALFGSEQIRPLEGGYLALVDFLNETNCHRVSVDMPSGLFAEPSKQIDPEHIFRAERTFVLCAPKLSCFLSEYAPFVGQWSVMDMALDEQTYRELETSLLVSTDESMAHTIHRREAFTTLEDYGEVLLCGGDAGYLGRMALASRASFRVGCGAVSALLPVGGSAVIATSVPEVRTLESISMLLEELNSYRVIGLTASLTPELMSTDRLSELIAQATRPLIIDAGMYRLRAESYQSLIDKTPAGSIVCFSRADLDHLVAYFSSDAERLEYITRLATRLGIYIVLKGTYTAVCLRSGNIIFNTTGNPGMATAGSADVLLGAIAGLLAQGYPASSATVLGVYLHGLAGDIYAGKHSQVSLTASDIVANLPVAFHQLSDRD